MVAVSWGIEGVLIVLLALAVQERSFRLTGLGMLLLCVAKAMALDVWGLQARDRYITFIIVVAALVFVSFLYTRYRDAIRQFLCTPPFPSCFFFPSRASRPPYSIGPTP